MIQRFDLAETVAQSFRERTCPRDPFPFRASIRLGGRTVPLAWHISQGNGNRFEECRCETTVGNTPSACSSLSLLSGHPSDVLLSQPIFIFLSFSFVSDPSSFHFCISISSRFSFHFSFLLHYILLVWHFRNVYCAVTFFLVFKELKSTNETNWSIWD